MQLTQQETNKIKERDEQHTQELREWRNDLTKKKQVCVENLRGRTVASYIPWPRLLLVSSLHSIKAGGPAW